MTIYLALFSTTIILFFAFVTTTILTYSSEQNDKPFYFTGSVICFIALLLQLCYLVDYYGLPNKALHEYQGENTSINAEVQHSAEPVTKSSADTKAVVEEHNKELEKFKTSR